MGLGLLFAAFALIVFLIKGLPAGVAAYRQHMREYRAQRQRRL